MVLPISGFLPVPLPMMIPFMGAQSLVIGKMFGEGFQYGKRKISAMPNEEFNKLTFEAMMSNARSEMQASIPTMIQAMQDMKPMVTAVVHEFTNYLSLVIGEAPKQVEQVVGSIEAMLLALIGQTKGAADPSELTDLLEQIRLAFPNLPTAAGSDLQVGSQVGIDLTKQSTISGLTVGQAQDQARQKQLLVEQQQRDFDRLKASQVGTAPIRPQVPKGFKFKKAAGQSQKMERLRLIKLIAQLGKDAKFLDAEPARKHAFNRMLFEQQMLVNLLARYTF